MESNQIKDAVDTFLFVLGRPLSAYKYIYIVHQKIRSCATILCKQGYPQVILKWQRVTSVDCITGKECNRAHPDNSFRIEKYEMSLQEGTFDVLVDLVIVVKRYC